MSPHVQIAVVAGNRGQAQNWAREGHLRAQDWFYVSSDHSLRGVSYVVFAFVGTYYSHPYIASITAQVKMIRSTNG